AQRFRGAHGGARLYRKAGAPAFGMVSARTQVPVKRPQATGNLRHPRGRCRPRSALGCLKPATAPKGHSMSYVIDRRLNGKNKSTVNRQRFLSRYRGHIKKAVEEAVGRRSITDMEHGEQITIPGRD